MSAPTVFDIRAVEFGYTTAQRPALSGVTASVASGAFHAIIGPNGSGKTTLLKLLLAVLRPSAGTIHYEGRDVRAWPRREIARRIGVVSQVEEMPFPLKVRELVAMGRYPHLGPWRRAGHDDEMAIEAAMERCQVSELAARTMDRLSGGERQRARLARALAQGPSTLVLDEPTASLDIAYEMAIFELLSDLSKRDGRTVVVVTHNLNLASRYADELLLLDNGAVLAAGRPAEVLTQDVIESAYHWPIRIVSHPGPGADAGAPQITPLSGPARAGAGSREPPEVPKEKNDA
jgi:iron complex transport system ATP-binding protein